MEPRPCGLLDQVRHAARLKLFEVHREPGLHARTRYQGTTGRQ